MGEPKQGFQELPLWHTSHRSDNALASLTVFVTVILDNFEPNVFGRIAA